MIASSLIDKQIPVLDTQMPVNQAKDLMEESKLFHLPVVKNKKFIGIVSYDELELLKGENDLAMIAPQIFSTVSPQAHFFEIWSRMVEDHITGIAVVDDQENYLGFIRQEALIQFYAKSFALTEPGCIVLLSMRKMDYSLSRIASLVEEVGHHVLSGFVMEKTDPSEIIITLKLNAIDPEPVINSFLRHQIDVEGVYSENEFTDIIRDRYEQLMSYLNV